MVKKTFELVHKNECNVMLCNIHDSIYPKGLIDMDSPPAVIYYRVDISRLNEIYPKRNKKM